MRILLRAIALAIFLFSPSAQAEEQAYTIRLSRPTKVGDRFRLIANSRHAERVAIFIGEVPVKTRIDDYNVELNGTLTALEVARNGNVGKSALVIEKLMFTSGGETKALFGSGTTAIVSDNGERRVYTINDMPADALAEKALRAVLSGAISSGPTDDEAFGTEDKKRVGDSWQVNRDLLVKSLYEKGKLSVDIADVQGLMTLQGVVKGGPRDYLVIGGSINIERFTVPLPPEFNAQEGKIEINFSGRFPAAEERTRLSQSLQMTAWFSAVGPADSTLRGFFEETRSIELQDPN